MSLLAPSPRAAQFESDGYLLVRGLFSAGEVSEIAARFAEIHREGVPGFYEPRRAAVGEAPLDPLDAYPRVMQPHRFDALSRRYLLHPGVRAVLVDILGEEPFAVQSMFYFKPPGARGQEMHQDQFYLQVEPGTCVAAWTAIDRCDAENGAMMVAPRTNHHAIVCPEEADEARSFTKHYVRPPRDAKPVLVEMEPGDTLFFNGSAIHGSGPNRSRTRFRRAFISHYATGGAERISRHYQPVLRFDGRESRLEDNTDNGPCGVPWDVGVH